MDCGNSADVLLRVQDLRTHFYTYEGIVQAVNDVTFCIHRGEIIGLVGESGSGKSVTALSIMRLVRPPGKIIGGEVLFENRNLVALSEAEMQEIRGREIAMIFQEARPALNPLFPIGYQIARVLRLRKKGISKKEARQRTVNMLRSVRIPDPEKRFRAYPHELSSGMCQRVMIAIALSGNPKMLIADEPTTGLDVTVQVRVLDLLRERVRSAQVTCLFITHDLGIVAELCDRIVIMYAGRVVETGTVEDIFHNPRHPYTKGLIQSTLRVDIEETVSTIPGVVPDAIHLPSGCKFHPRCPFAEELCEEEEPDIIPAGYEHYSRCHIVSGRIVKEMRKEAWEVAFEE
jgi:oligopeptide/dipeptide ABC transporter ATP-binding protein